ncbi:hypothetical protein [Candidatus Tisiphia endosymbiont of Dioctria linearis]|uniref:hypothetical protein n=1 Tax=Candidatus Tisiphia endosymbiont of Dioctria linearis TaxID=3066254 RepID=UPI00312C72C2
MDDLIMSEELLQRDLIKNPQKIGSWNFYNIGSTTISALKKSDIIRSIDYGNVSNKRVDAIITKKKKLLLLWNLNHLNILIPRIKKIMPFCKKLRLPKN